VRESERVNPQETCQKIIDYLISDGFKYQVAKKDVIKAIMWIRGIDERTVGRWLKALETFEYLIPINPNIYKLNPLKIPNIINNLKQNPQTKIM